MGKCNPINAFQVLGVMPRASFALGLAAAFAEKHVRRRLCLSGDAYFCVLPQSLWTCKVRSSEWCPLPFPFGAVGKKLRVVARLAFVASAGRQWFVSGLVNFWNAMRSRKAEK